MLKKLHPGEAGASAKDMRLAFIEVAERSTAGSRGLQAPIGVNSFASRERRLRNGSIFRRANDKEGPGVSSVARATPENQPADNAGSKPAPTFSAGRTATSRPGMHALFRLN